MHPRGLVPAMHAIDPKEANGAGRRRSGYTQEAAVATDGRAPRDPHALAPPYEKRRIPLTGSAEDLRRT